MNTNNMKFIPANTNDPLSKFQTKTMLYYPIIDKNDNETKMLVYDKDSKIHQVMEQSKETFRVTGIMRTKLLLFKNMGDISEQAYRGLIAELDDIDNNMSFTITKDGIKRDR